MEPTLLLLVAGLVYVIWHLSTHGWHPEPGGDFDDTDNANPDLPWEEGEYHF